MFKNIVVSVVTNTVGLYISSILGFGSAKSSTRSAKLGTAILFHRMAEFGRIICPREYVKV